MAQKICTPFCDSKKGCPGHHELLLALLNCSDRKDQQANVAFEQFQSTVKAHLKKGWKLDDEVPDPVRNYRFPLLHWAGVLGKSRVMEWMIKFGFNPTVCTSATKETALHRCVLCLHYSSVRRPGEKVCRVVHMLKDCLLLQDKALQTPLHAAAEKLVTGNKSDYFAECLEAMVAKAKEMPGKTAEILNTRDHLGNTALHYLAQNEIGFVALRAIVNAGGDVTVVNKKKLTPLNIAMNSGSTRIIKVLRTAGERKLNPNMRYDSNVYSTDSPPESPVNLAQEEGGDTSENDDPSHETSEKSQCGPTHSISTNTTDTPATECSEDPSCSSNGGENVPVDVTKDTSLDASHEPCSPITDASCGTVNDASVSTPSEAPSASASNVPPPPDDSSLQEECEYTGVGVQMAGIDPYSCIVHIKQEVLSPCERCQQESMAEISSSSELTFDSGNPVLSLLRGAGLLQNLTQIAEKARNEDEHVLTDKLEMVKETNSQLEKNEKVIEDKNTRIATLVTELEELKQEMQGMVDERERLFRKRKLLNEECNSLQKKLHCCDSLLKVVPK